MLVTPDESYTEAIPSMTPSEQSYREIPLSQGQVALVDAEDYERVLAESPWFYFKASGGLYYAAHNSR